MVHQELSQLQTVDRARRTFTWALVGLLAVALALRLLGLWWGLPNSQHDFSYHPDEIFLLLPSFGFAQGDWNPHFFNYGSLYPYLVGLPAVAFGLVPDAATFPGGLRPLYLEARLITALLGAATVLLLFLSLRRGTIWLAGLSALVLAIFPLHVIESHYATVDVPATFFLVLAFFFALRATDQPRALFGLLAGLSVGLAAATKYNCALFLPIALIAPLFGPKLRFPVRWWLPVLAGAALGFLIGNPYFHSPDFLRGLLFELRHAREGGTTAFIGTGSGWAYHLLHGLPVALGYPLLAAAVFGFIAGLFRAPASVRLSSLWVVLYLFAIGFGRERFIRYLVPLAPFLSIIAAWGLMSLVLSVRRLRRRGLGLSIGLAILLLTGLYTAGLVTTQLLAPDPRDVAWSTARTEVLSADPAATVGLVTLPWYYSPPVSPYNAGAFSQQWFEEWNRSHGDRVRVTGWNGPEVQANPPTIFFLSDLETADLKRLGRFETIQFLGALDSGYSLERRFWRRPSIFAWLAPGWSWAPPDWLYTAPRVTMYSRWSE